MSIKKLKNSEITFYKYKPNNMLQPHQFWAGKMKSVHINITIEKNSSYYKYIAKFNPKRTRGYEVKKEFICQGKANNIKDAQSKVKNDLFSELGIKVYFDRNKSYNTYPDFN